MLLATEEFFNSLFLKKLFKGLALTGRYLFARKVTVLFPREKIPLPPRFRGLRALRRHPSGEERYIACKLREAVCPALTITIESDQRDDGTRRIMRYDIDLTRCIFCGFYEEACPMNAIVETHVLEYYGKKRGDLYFTKNMLLAVGDRFEPEIAASKAANAKYRWFRTSAVQLKLVGVAVDIPVGQRLLRNQPIAVASCHRSFGQARATKRPVPGSWRSR